MVCKQQATLETVYVPWKIACGKQKPALQALQFQKITFCSRFPDGVGSSQSRYRSNEYFVDI